MTDELAERRTASRIYQLLRQAKARTGFTDIFARTLASYIANGLHDDNEQQ